MRRAQETAARACNKCGVATSETTPLLGNTPLNWDTGSSCSQSADMELKNLVTVVYGFLTFTVVVLVAVLVCACVLIARPGLFTGAGLPNHRLCGELL